MLTHVHSWRGGGGLMPVLTPGFWSHDLAVCFGLPMAVVHCSLLSFFFSPPQAVYDAFAEAEGEMMAEADAAPRGATGLVHLVPLKTGCPVPRALMDLKFRLIVLETAPSVCVQPAPPPPDCWLSPVWL